MKNKSRQTNHQTTGKIMIGDQELGILRWEEVLEKWQAERFKFFMELKRQGLTNEEIAAKCNVTRQNVGKILGLKKEWAPFL